MGVHREKEFFIDNLLVRIHLIIVMIRWTGLAPWECGGHLVVAVGVGLARAARGNDFRGT